MSEEGVGRTDWLLVAHNVLHLEGSRDGQSTWWCVDRRCKRGDRVFVYKPRSGILVFCEIVGEAEPQGYCEGFAMNTVKVKIVRRFDPPIPAGVIRNTRYARLENCVRRSFQGKAFKLKFPETVDAILGIKA
jgi:hypothetical protein